MESRLIATTTETDVLCYGREGVPRSRSAAGQEATNRLLGDSSQITRSFRHGLIEGDGSGAKAEHRVDADGVQVFKTGA